MLAPFTTHCVELMDDVGDGNVGSPMTFQESSENILYMGMMNDDNETCMMDIDGNIYDLKYYVATLKNP